MPMPVTCCDSPSGTVEPAVQQPEGGAGQRRDQHAEPEIAARIDREPAGERAGRHDALDAQVEHAGPLADQLAQVPKISGVAIRTAAAQSSSEQDVDRSMATICHAEIHLGTARASSSASAGSSLWPSEGLSRSCDACEVDAFHRQRRRKRVNIMATTMVSSAARPSRRRCSWARRRRGSWRRRPRTLPATKIAAATTPSGCSMRQHGHDDAGVAEARRQIEREIALEPGHLADAGEPGQRRPRAARSSAARRRRACRAKRAARGLWPTARIS